MLTEEKLQSGEVEALPEVRDCDRQDLGLQLGQVHGVRRDRVVLEMPSHQVFARRLQHKSHDSH